VRCYTYDKHGYTGQALVDRRGDQPARGEGGDPLRAVPERQGADRRGLRVLRALQPMSVAHTLDHRLKPRTNYVNVLRGDNVLKRSLKPLAADIGDLTLDFRKLRRSHSTFYAVLNVHPRVAQMSMGHGSFDTTMKYYTGVPADLQKQAAEALGDLLFGVQDGSIGSPTPVKPRGIGRTQNRTAAKTPANRGV
jgi:hypothetical protein